MIPLIASSILASDTYAAIVHFAQVGLEIKFFQHSASHAICEFLLGEISSTAPSCCLDFCVDKQTSLSFTQCQLFGSAESELRIVESLISSCTLITFYIPLVWLFCDFRPLGAPLLSLCPLYDPFVARLTPLSRL